MEKNQIEIVSALQSVLDGAENAALVGLAIFIRISAIMFLLPGFGERHIPAQIKLAAALAFAVVCWPLVSPLVADKAGALQPTLSSIGVVLIAEAAIGLVLGVATRLLVFAMQTAGMIMAQNLSLSQLFGGIDSEPSTTIATILTMAGIAMAMALGLHIKAAALIVDSYRALPLGVFPVSGDVATWATERVGAMFSLAISLAMPFIVAAFIYNMALGFINKAMPQMMVFFVGMPAILMCGILLLMLTAGAIVMYWHDHLDLVLNEPLATEH